MKNFNLISLLAAATILTLNLMACSSLDPHEDLIFEQNPTSHTTVLHMDDPLEDGTNPEENVLMFKITPEDGWEVHPGEIILFQAWFLNESTGIYVEVTNSPDCNFYSAQFGKSVNGDDPSLTNGQEITISAIYKNKTYACSTGKYIANPE